MFKDRPTLASRLPYILSLLSLVVAAIAVVLILQSSTASNGGDNGSTTDVAMTDSQSENPSAENPANTPSDNEQEDADDTESTTDEEDDDDGITITYPDLSQGKDGSSYGYYYSDVYNDLTVWGDTYLMGDLHVSGESFHKGAEHYYDIIDARGTIVNEKGVVVIDDSLVIEDNLFVNGNSYHKGNEYFEFTDTNTAYINDLIVRGTSEHFGPELYHGEIDARMHIVNNGDCEDGYALQTFQDWSEEDDCDAPVNIWDDLVVSYDTTLEGDLYVHGESFHYAPEHYFDAVNIHGKTTIYNDLQVTEDFYLQGDARFFDDLHLSDKLFVQGDSIFYNDLNIGDDLTVEDNAIVHGDLTVYGESYHYDNEHYFAGINSQGEIYNSTGNVVIADSLNVEYDLILGDDLFVADDAEIGDSLTVNGELTAFGPVTVNAQLTTTDLLVTGSASINLFDSHLLPEVTNTYNLGSSTNRWLNLWANNGNFSGDMTIAGTLLVGPSALNVADELASLDSRVGNLEYAVYVDHAGKISTLETTVADHASRITTLEARNQVIGGVVAVSGTPSVLSPVTVVIPVGYAHQALTVTPMGTGLQTATIKAGANTSSVTIEIYGTGIIGATLTGIQWTAVL